MAIALMVTLAITSVMINTQGAKRSTTSVNDVNQTGAYIAYVLDRSIRNAGSGFSQRWTDSFGCTIHATKGGTAILPLPTALAAPFANVPLAVRVAPIIIGKGLADAGTSVRGDVLTVMGGTTGYGETQQVVVPNTTTFSSIGLGSAQGYLAGDLTLLTGSDMPGGCLLEQVSGTTGQTVNFGGDYIAPNPNFLKLSSVNAATSIRLGNATDNAPQLQLYGVGANNTLFALDLLQASGAIPVQIADGVVEMRALYGLDTTTPPDGVLDTWIDPVAGSGYSQADLTDGSGAAQLKLRRIVAIRLGLILRTSLKERTAVVPDPTTLTLFTDLGPGLQQTRSITGDDAFYRFRTIEITVPLRNVLFAPQS